MAQVDARRRRFSAFCPHVDTCPRTPHPARVTFLSDFQFERARRAAKHIDAGARALPLLSNLAWDSDIREDFLRHDKTPDPDYPDVDTDKALNQIADARSLIDGDHVVMQWLGRLCDTVERTASLLDNRGTPAFFECSKALFGDPQKLMIDRQTRTIDFARYLDETLLNLDFSHLVMEGEKVYLTDREFADAMRGKLDRHFGDDAPRVILSPSLSAKATASASRIRVRKGETFTERDVLQLLQHEALIHTATALNGRAQTRFRILGRAHGGTTMIQEGLAVFAEIITATMDPRRFQRLAARVIAIDMAADGADFREVFQYFVERTDDRRSSYESTRRIFRGGVISGGAPFTKDGVYLNGLLRVHNFMRTVVGLDRADLIRILFMGKMDLEDVPAIAQLSSRGVLAAPQFLPSWVKDMRFLVSYMSYSGFLNRVKLPGFQDYYREQLSEVPTVWDAVE